MEKKNLTIKQQKRRLRLKQYACRGGEYVSVLLPYSIMAIVNHNEWFVLNPEPWKVGLGGSIGMVLAALSVFLVNSSKTESKLTTKMISMIIMWYAITFVFFLLANINMEIYKIMAYGGMGLIGAVGLEYGSEHYQAQADLKEQAIKQGNMNDDVEQYKEEKKQEQKAKKKKIAVD